MAYLYDSLPRSHTQQQTSCRPWLQSCHTSFGSKIMGNFSGHLVNDCCKYSLGTISKRSNYCHLLQTVVMEQTPWLCYSGNNIINSSFVVEPNNDLVCIISCELFEVTMNALVLTTDRPMPLPQHISLHLTPISAGAGNYVPDMSAIVPPFSIFCPSITLKLRCPSNSPCVPQIC